MGGREPADLPRGSKSENLESRAAPIFAKLMLILIENEITLETGLEIGSEVWLDTELKIGLLDSWALGLLVSWCLISWSLGPWSLGLLIS